MELSDLEDAYEEVSQDQYEPNFMTVSIQMYSWIMQPREVPLPKPPDFWETDDFVNWGRAVYKEAHRPKNATLRQFLGQNRWERRRS